MGGSLRAWCVNSVSYSVDFSTWIRTRGYNVQSDKDFTRQEVFCFLRSEITESAGIIFWLKERRFDVARKKGSYLHDSVLETFKNNPVLIAGKIFKYLFPVYLASSFITNPSKPNSISYQNTLNTLHHHLPYLINSHLMLRLFRNHLLKDTSLNVTPHLILH